MTDIIQIFATSKYNGERREIDDLYFFEEQGIHDFDGEAHYDRYSFEIFVNGKQVYPTGELESAT